MTKDEFIIVVYRALRDSITKEIDYVSKENGKIKVETKSDFDETSRPRTRQVWYIVPDCIIGNEANEKDGVTDANEKSWKRFFKRKK